MRRTTADAMQVAVGGVVGLGASEVLALSFHPGRDELVAAAGAHGYELIEADAITRHVLARTPLMRRLRHLWHQLSGTDAAVLILAYDCGDIEVWDSEPRVQKDRMLPTKKDEGKAVTAVASGASHTGAVIYYARGGSAIERAEVGTSKSLRYGRFPGRAQVRRALGTLDACRRGGPVDACPPMGRARANPCAGLRCACRHAAAYLPPVSIVHCSACAITQSTLASGCFLVIPHSPRASIAIRSSPMPPRHGRRATTSQCPNCASLLSGCSRTWVNNGHVCTRLRPIVSAE